MDIKEVKRLIQKARKLSEQKSIVTLEIFNILEKSGIDLENKSNADNADDLEQAITCYIDYNEYNIKSIIEEIKSQLN